MYSGECNSCGICCCLTRDIGGKRTVFRCVNLLVAGKIGTPGATECAQHKTKYDGMPILMLTEDGTRGYPSKCLSSYPREKDAIPPECSYFWVSEIEKKPEWNMMYVPKS